MCPYHLRGIFRNELLVHYQIFISISIILFMILYPSSKKEYRPKTNCIIHLQPWLKYDWQQDLTHACKGGHTPCHSTLWLFRQCPCLRKAKPGVPTDESIRALFSQLPPVLVYGHEPDGHLSVRAEYPQQFDARRWPKRKCKSDAGSS